MSLYACLKFLYSLPSLGTALNNIVIQGRCRLTDGDKLRLSGVEFSFRSTPLAEIPANRDTDSDTHTYVDPPHTLQDSSVHVTMEMPGFRTPEDHEFVRAVRAAASAVGMDAPVGGWTAACDGGFVARDLGIPTVVAGPGGLNDQAHQVDESVGVAELVAAARWYAALAWRLVGPASSTPAGTAGTAAT